MKGFTLDFNDAQKINFESIKMLLAPDPLSRSIITTNPRKITRDKNQALIYNRKEDKNIVLYIPKDMWIGLHLKLIHMDFNCLYMQFNLFK